MAGALGPDGGVALADDAFEHLVSLAGGDARAALNVLEGAVGAGRADEGVRDEAGHVTPRLEDIETAAQQRVLAYDRAGDGHYDTVSAFIKSLRGNDPDAALYWLAAMVAAGEDPRFIARRLIISASEDVGNADPRALQVAVAAAQALDWIGLPEAQYALAQATTYIATAPKSNRSGAAYWAAVGGRRGARARCRCRSTCGTPAHRRHEAARDRRRVPLPATTSTAPTSSSSTCPTSSTDRRYYLPTDQGYEATIAARMAARAEARAAAKAAGKTPRSGSPGPSRRRTRATASCARARRTARSSPRPRSATRPTDYRPRDRDRAERLGHGE